MSDQMTREETRRQVAMLVFAHELDGRKGQAITYQQVEHMVATAWLTADMFERCERDGYQSLLANPKAA